MVFRTDLFLGPEEHRWSCKTTRGWSLTEDAGYDLCGDVNFNIYTSHSLAPFVCVYSSVLTLTTPFFPWGSVIWVLAVKPTAF